MSFRGCLGPASRSVTPALATVGLAVVVGQTVLPVGIIFALGFLSKTPPGLLAPVASLFALVLTLPLRLGLYEPVRADAAGLRSTVRSAVGGIRRQYRRVLVAEVAAVTVAAVGATTAALLWVVIDTGRRYLVLHSGGLTNPQPTGLLYALGALWAVVFVVLSLLTLLADVFAAYGDVAPHRAWLSSLRVARRHPVSFLGCTVVQLFLLGGAGLLWGLFELSWSPLELLLVASAATVGSTVAVVLAAAIHVTFFQRVGIAAIGSSRPPSISWARVGLVVVLLAGVSGASYVRFTDPGVSQDAIEPLPDDPAVALDVAQNNTVDANHRLVVEQRNVSSETERRTSACRAGNGTEGTSQDGCYRTIFRQGVDYDDRQMDVQFVQNGSVLAGGYFGEGVFTVRQEGIRSSPTSLFTRQRGNHTLFVSPGFGIAMSGPRQSRILGDVGLRTVASNESTVVYRTDSPGTVEQAVPETWTAGESLGDESYLVAVVDRDLGVLRRVRFRQSSTENGMDRVVSMRYAAIGTADLQRPDEIGSRSVGEWLWDLSYY
jgi:hypothetical protein